MQPLSTAAQFGSFDHVSAEAPRLSARDAHGLPSYTNSLWTTWAGDLISLSSVWRLPCELVRLCHGAATAPGESRRHSIAWHQWGTIGCSSHATIECFRWHLMFTFISRLLINLTSYRNNLWHLFQKTCLSSERKQSPHNYYFTRSGFNIITRPINHIQFLFCYFTALRRRSSSHKTGSVNKWLQIMQSINSRGTCKYQAVRSKWKPLVCSDRRLWIPPT